MNRGTGRILGLIRIVVWIGIIFFATLMLPVSLYYQNLDPPSWLAWLYQVSWFNWETGILIGISFIVIGFGLLLIYGGWQQIYRIKIGKGEK